MRLYCMLHLIKEDLCRNIYCLLVEWQTLERQAVCECWNDRMQRTLRQRRSFSLCHNFYSITMLVNWTTAFYFQIVCTIFATLLYYFLLVAFLWMLMEGIQLYILLVQIFPRGEGFKKQYYVICWGKCNTQGIISLCWYGISKEP